MTPENRAHIKTLITATTSVLGGRGEIKNVLAHIDDLADQTAAVYGEDPAEVRVLLLEAIYEARQEGKIK